jgi:hypothetical protein
MHLDEFHPSRRSPGTFLGTFSVLFSVSASFGGRLSAEQIMVKLISEAREIPKVLGADAGRCNSGRGVSLEPETLRGQHRSAGMSSPIAVGVTGRIAVGKTTVSKALAFELRGVWVGLSEYIGSLAPDRLQRVTRSTLQDRGQQLVAKDAEAFCRGALRWAGWNRGQSLVVDGIRHQVVIATLRRIVAPTPFVLVYFLLDDKTHETRLAKKGISGLGELENIETHIAEREVPTELRNSADVTVCANGTPEQIALQTVARLGPWIR